MANNNDDKEVLAVANGYLQKYYFNPDYQNLPAEIKKQIKLLCIRFVEEVGGILEMSYQPDGSLQLITHVEENDLLFDEIGAELLIKEYQREEEELFAKLELYFKSTKELQ